MSGEYDDLLSDLTGVNPDAAAEPAGDPDRVPLDTGQSGYLTQYPIENMTFVKTTDEDGSMALWMRASVIALGVLRDANGEAQYLVRTVRDTAKGEVARESVLTAGDLANSTRLNAWAFSFAAPFENPPKAKGGLSHASRLSLYLDSQNPPEFRVVPMGYDTESVRFVVQDGTIGADGWRPFTDCRPDPKTTVDWSYGHDVGLDECRDELGELLDYQELGVSAVVLSWLVAVTLKPLLQESVFPILAVQAAYGKGKSNGLLKNATAAFGLKSGGGDTTAPYLRTTMGGHVSGCTWVDEIEAKHVGDVTDVLRWAATGQDYNKMGGDQFQNRVKQELTAAALVSSQSLGAIVDPTDGSMRERVLLVDWGDPTDRPSSYGNDSQYRDMVDQIGRYGKNDRDASNLNALAGGIVQLILQEAGDVQYELRMLLSELTLKKSTSRVARKYAILQIGARVLARVLKGAKGDVVAVVDRYVEENVQADSTRGKLNTLTGKLMPWALTFYGLPEDPYSHTQGKHDLPAPVIVKWADVEKTQLASMWVNYDQLAELMRRERNDDRLGSPSALQDEGNAVGIGGAMEGKRFGDRSNPRIRYRAVPIDVAEVVLKAAYGS